MPGANRLIGSIGLLNPDGIHMAVQRFQADSCFLWPVAYLWSDYSYGCLLEQAGTQSTSGLKFMGVPVFQLRSSQLLMS